MLPKISCQCLIFVYYHIFLEIILYSTVKHLHTHTHTHIITLLFIMAQMWVLNNNKFGFLAKWPMAVFCQNSCLLAVYKELLLWSCFKRRIQDKLIPSPYHSLVIVFLLNKAYNDSLVFALTLCELCITWLCHPMYGMYVLLWQILIQANGLPLIPRRQMAIIKLPSQNSIPWFHA